MRCTIVALLLAVATPALGQSPTASTTAADQDLVCLMAMSTTLGYARNRSDPTPQQAETLRSFERAAAYFAGAGVGRHPGDRLTEEMRRAMAEVASATDESALVTRCDGRFRAGMEQLRQATRRSVER